MSGSDSRLDFPSAGRCAIGANEARVEHSCVAAHRDEAHGPCPGYRWRGTDPHSPHERRRVAIVGGDGDGRVASGDQICSGGREAGRRVGDDRVDQFVALQHDLDVCRLRSANDRSIPSRCQEIAKPRSPRGQRRSVHEEGLEGGRVEIDSKARRPAIGAKA